VSDLLINGRPDDCRSLCYVALKSRHPALAAAFGAERHISTGATFRIKCGAPHLMREIRTSGSVRGGDGNVPTYSALKAAESAETVGKCRGSGQRRERAGKAQLGRLERRTQPLEKQRPEPSGEDPHGQKEPRPARDPSRLIKRKAAARDDAVQMRMVVQRRRPRCAARRPRRSRRRGGADRRRRGTGWHRRCACSGTRSPPPPAG
jgi:hypothetical protein